MYLNQGCSNDTSKNSFALHITSTSALRSFLRYRAHLPGPHHSCNLGVVHFRNSEIVAWAEADDIALPASCLDFVKPTRIVRRRRKNLFVHESCEVVLRKQNSQLWRATGARRTNVPQRQTFPRTSRSVDLQHARSLGRGSTWGRKEAGWRLAEAQQPLARVASSCGL